MDFKISEMDPADKRRMNRIEFRRKYGKYWLVYIALLITGTLSATAGVLLPMQPDETGQVHVTLGVILSCIFYAVGFLATGEGASYYWFDKLTDHDPDNQPQVAISVLMLILSVLTSLTTAMAAGTFIAYLLGRLTAFDIMPLWAQNWVVYAIPALLAAHMVAGMAFKAISDEASADRKAKACVRKVQNDMARVQSEAYAKWYESHAPQQAKALGEMQAQKELEDMRIKLGNAQPETAPDLFTQALLQPASQLHMDTKIAAGDDGKGIEPFPSRSPRE